MYDCLFSDKQITFLIKRRQAGNFWPVSAFTFLLSSIRDESGGIGTLFHPVNETTQKIIGECLLKILRDLAKENTGDAVTILHAGTIYMHDRL